ncbi:MAG: DUF692 family protein [Burkholderiaceae bacterium]|nr:DUF692 family protein [Burkholderiaceae bacterium]
MNSSPLASQGFGLGLRTAHYQDFLTSPQRVDWLEIITDNFLVAGGKPLVVLDAIRRDYPIAMHGVAMSIGSAAGLDVDYLARVKQLARRIEPMWISDHLCWTGFAGNVLHDLYPMPYTEESARLLIAQIRQAQDVLERRLVIENVSSYVRFSSSSETEWAFLAHVIEEADCELLLDVNNVYVSSINHGFSALAYLDGLPAARVRQIHLAGHSQAGDHIIDTHDHPVSPEVWALYAAACRRFPLVATMIERDDNVPPLSTLIEELDQAREIAARSIVQADLVANRMVRECENSPCRGGELSSIQHRLAEYIVSETPTGLPYEVDPAGPMPGERGMQIYHRAYRERLTEVLADSYPKCQLYLGTALFKELAYRYISGHPPQERHLGSYGADFAIMLDSVYPDNAELSELALLEWALREVFDDANVPAWTVCGIEEAGPDACLASGAILHPSLRLHALRTNAVSIWHAIDGDNEVPEVVRWEHPRVLAVWRKGLRPHFKSLDSDEAGFLLELVPEGATIAAVADAWGASGRLPDPAVLGGWLANWWSDELLRRDTPSYPNGGLCN